MESNEQNKLKNKVETDSWIENRLPVVRGMGRGSWGLGEKGEGIKQRKNKKTHGHQQEYGNCQRERRKQGR